MEREAVTMVTSQLMRSSWVGGAELKCEGDGELPHTDNSTVDYACVCVC